MQNLLGTEISCHCKNVSINCISNIQSATSCNCSYCSRLGVLWVYVSSDDVVIRTEEKQNLYKWGKGLRNFYSCAKCHCVTHYSQTNADNTTKIAINIRLAPSAIYSKLPLRFFDGANTFTYIV